MSGADGKAPPPPPPGAEHIENPEDLENPDEFKIGFDSADPQVMVIQVPIRAWAQDLKHGTALFHGHMREAEAVGMRQLTMIRQRHQKRTAIIGTDGQPITPKLH